MKIVLCVLGTMMLAACGSSATPAASNAAATVSALSLSESTAAGTVIVTPAGTPPFAAQVVGTCATLAQPSTTTSFTLSVTAGICTLVVADASSRFRSLQITGSPPRTFLAVNPVLADAGGTTHFSVGATQTFTVSESLLQIPINAPYGAQIFGSCVTLSGSSTPPNAPATFALTGAAAGQCVAVFTDTAGEAIGINFSI